MPDVDSTVKHTPGPWVISDAQIGYFVIIAAGRPEPPRRDHSLAYGSKDPRFYRREPLDYPVISVSEAFDTVYSLEQATANARLIAASPDLLEACRDMETWFSAQISAGKLRANVELDRIRAAISKTTEGE